MLQHGKGFISDRLCHLQKNTKIKFEVIVELINVKFEGFTANFQTRLKVSLGYVDHILARRHL